MKTTEEKIEVMKAYAEGKKIEMSVSKLSDAWSEWVASCEPDWNWEICDYRIKSEPKYRPFKNINELVLFWEAHYCNSNRPKGTMPLIWVKSDDYTNLITSYDYSDGTILGDTWTSLEELFKRYTFIDGKPCGVEE